MSTWSSPIKKLYCWFNFLSQNLHLVGCATMCSKSEVILMWIYVVGWGRRKSTINWHPFSHAKWPSLWSWRIDVRMCNLMTHRADGTSWGGRGRSEAFLDFGKSANPNPIRTRENILYRHFNTCPPNLGFSDLPPALDASFLSPPPSHVQPPLPNNWLSGWLPEILAFLT